ncbi:MAG TPA: alpha/beta hydrolase [Ferruginibacter sp.]|nr:alpha/beta hydrolase [Ferruginibacter sp.]
MIQEKFLHWKEKKICYRIAGAGRPVLLLHGFGEDGQIWNQQLTELEESYLLIIPDIPGSGKSEWVGGAGIDDYAEIIKKITDAEAVSPNNPVAFIGHSMGGYIALAFAERYPEFLAGLSLFHSSAYADSEEKKKSRQKAITFIEEKGAAPFLQTAIPGLFSEGYKQSNPEKVEALVHDGHQFSAEALVQYYQAMIARPDRTAVLHNITRPVLFIIGQYDTAVPMQASLEQSHLPQVSIVHILRYSGHMGMWEETGRVNEILNSFLSVCFA